MDSFEIKPWRKLVVAWHFAPFGLIKFPVWLWRYVTLESKLRRIAEKAHELDTIEAEIAAGVYAARLYCQLFPVHIVYESAKERVVTHAEGVSGKPLDVAFYAYLHKHPERRQ